ncbi:hypothetical protein ACX84Z_33765, partial [Burkholderia pseudomallei]
MRSAARIDAALDHRLPCMRNGCDASAAPGYPASTRARPPHPGPRFAPRRPDIGHAPAPETARRRG